MGRSVEFCDDPVAAVVDGPGEPGCDIDTDADMGKRYRSIDLYGGGDQQRWYAGIYDDGIGDKRTGSCPEAGMERELQLVRDSSERPNSADDARGIGCRDIELHHGRNTAGDVANIADQYVFESVDDIGDVELGECSECDELYGAGIDGIGFFDDII